MSSFWIVRVVPRRGSSRGRRAAFLHGVLVDVPAAEHLQREVGERQAASEAKYFASDAATRRQAALDEVGGPPAPSRTVFVDRLPRRSPCSGSVTRSSRARRAGDHRWVHGLVAVQWLGAGRPRVEEVWREALEGGLGPRTGSGPCEILLTGPPMSGGANDPLVGRRAGVHTACSSACRQASWGRHVRDHHQAHVPPALKRKVRLELHQGTAYTCPLCGYPAKDLQRSGHDFAV